MVQIRLRVKGHAAVMSGESSRSIEYSAHRSSEGKR